jgi:hypothetical protein
VAAELSRGAGRERALAEFGALVERAVEQIEAEGIRPERQVLIGFSQGACSRSSLPRAPADRSKPSLGCPARSLASPMPKDRRATISTATGPNGSTTPRTFHTAGFSSAATRTTRTSRLPGFATASASSFRWGDGILDGTGHVEHHVYVGRGRDPHRVLGHRRAAGLDRPGQRGGAVAHHRPSWPACD